VLTGGQEFIIPVSLAGKKTMETTGPPKFLGNPECTYALLSDPGGPSAPGRKVR